MSEPLARIQTPLPPVGRSSDEDLKEEFDSKTPPSLHGDEEASIGETVQPGVAKVEAAQRAWSPQMRWILLGSLLLAKYILSLDSSTTYQYLTAIIYPVAGKLCDVFGRGETYIVAIVFYIIGLTLIATAQSIGAIAGGTIFDSIAGGMFYILASVVTADCTTLRWRAISVAVINAPYIINIFVAAEISQAILPTAGWRWGYGMFIIMTPILLSPVAGILLWSTRKAKKEGPQLAPSTLPNVFREPRRAAVAIFHFLDVMGLILLAGSLALILLPLSIAARASNGWATPHIIAMLVVGCMMLPCFFVWEIKYAEYPIASLKFFKNKNIASSCALGFMTNISWALINTYSYSFVYIVKTNWNPRVLSLFSNTQTFGLVFASILAGLYTARTRRFKWLLVFGLSLRALGCGVMIHARGAIGGDAELVITQLLQAFGNGLALMDLAAQASVTHSQVASVFALVYLSSTVGGAIGSALAGAVWTNLMPRELASHIPSANSTEITLLYSNIVVIHSEPAGSLIRTGAIAAYGDVMKILCIIGTIAALICVPIAIWGIDNIHLGDVQNAAEQKDLGGERGGAEVAVADEKRA